MSLSSASSTEKSVFRDFFLKVSETFLTRILILVIGLVVSIVIARLLGPTGQGLYATAVALGAVAVQFANLGLSTSNTYLAAKSENYLPTLFGNSLLLTFLSGGIVFIGIYLFAWWFPSWVPLQGALFHMTTVWVFPGVLLLYCQSLLLGLQRVRLYNVVDIIYRLIHLVLLGTVILFGFVSVESLYFIFLLAVALVTLWLAWKIFSFSEKKIPFPSVRLLKSTSVYGMSAYLGALFSYLCLRFDLLMVNSMAGPESAGFYSIAVSLADVVYTLPVVVGTILFSKLSAMNNFSDKKSFAFKVTGLLGILMFLGIGLAFFLVTPLLPLLYGDVYSPSILPFKYLLPGIFCLGLSTIIQNFIASTGRSWLMFVGPLLAFVVNLPLNYYLIPLYDKEGAAMASTLSYALWFILSLIILIRLQDKPERKYSLDVEGTHYFLSVYALTEMTREQMKDLTGKDLEGLEISTLVRSIGLKKLWFHLRRKNIENLYFYIPSGGEGSLREITCAFALFANARKLVFVGDQEQQIYGRTEMIKALIKVLKSTLLGRKSVKANMKNLRSLEGKDRISLDSVAKKSIFFLKANLWFGVKAGGSVGHVAGVVNAFQRLGHSVTCGAISKPLMLDDSVDYIELPFKRTFAYPVEVNNYLYSDDITEQLLNNSQLQEKTGFIYQRLSLGNYSGVMLSRFWKKPLILEYNGSEVWVSSNWGKKLKFHKLADLCERVCLAHAHLIVTVSDVLKDELIEKGIEPERIVSYPNCIDPQIFNPERFDPTDTQTLRESHDLSEKDQVVTFVGTFGKWHGVNILADTIEYQVKNQKALLDKCNIKFLLVGDGSEMSYVQEKLLTDEIRPYVRFTGLVEQHLAPLYLQASDILVSPHVPNQDGTRFFGSPTKLFEYMAMEKPIIASDLEQLSDIFAGSAHIDQNPSKVELSQSAALLIEPGDLNSFDKALRYLYENSDVHSSLAENARKRALDQYTWTIHVQKILDGLGRLEK